MQHDHVLKSGNLTYRPVGVCRQNIGSVPNRDSLKFDMQHDYVLKKWKFDLLTPSRGSEWGSVGKIFSTMLLH